MRAAIVHAFGAGPGLETDAPEPTRAEGEALVAIEAAAVGHLDVTIASGAFPLLPPLPYAPGTDAAGRVLAGGSLPAGTPVFVRGAGVGMTRSGCWAERVAVPAEALHPLQADVDPVLAATFFVPCSTAQVAVHTVGQLAKGERVAVRGAAGAVGSVAVQLALAGGATEVLGIVRTDESAAHVPPGARPVVAPGPAELAGLRGAGIDLLVDTVGGDGLPALVEAMRPGGRIVVVGYLAGTAVTLELPLLLARDVRLLPANQIRRQDALFAEAPVLLDALLRGELRLQTTAFPFERLEEAIAALGPGGPPGRVAILFEGV